ncbi:MAG TPA: hypothetical protein VHK26_00285 [Methyloceanibacter sp.]|nr:hypothetical protein [Methyloceanibacter sp.]
MAKETNADKIRRLSEEHEGMLSTYRSLMAQYEITNEQSFKDEAQQALSEADRIAIKVRELQPEEPRQSRLAVNLA